MSDVPKVLQVRSCEFVGANAASTDDSVIALTTDQGSIHLHVSSHAFDQISQKIERLRLLRLSGVYDDE